jgi:hypothetical protein
MRASRTLSPLFACLVLVACRGEAERRGEPSAAASGSQAAVKADSHGAPAAPASSWAIASASAPTAAAPAPSASAPLPTEPLARAEFAATKLGTTLKSKLHDALDAGGTVGAIDVCANEAQNVVAEVRKETGVTVGRASTKLRNAKDAAPEWVATWLKAQGTRGVGGAVGVREIVDVKDDKGTKKVAHVLRPIGIESACLGCHGDPASILPGVKSVLSSKYPSDQATGYKTGDLRGALWAEYPVAP